MLSPRTLLLNPRSRQLATAAFGLFALLVLTIAPPAAASSSANFILPFNAVNNGAQSGTSANFKAGHSIGDGIAAPQGASANFVMNSGFQAINLFAALTPQTITFGAQAAQTFAPAGTFAISPLATASSGLTVTYSSLTAAVCTVAGSTVTIVTVGTCTIAADQAGNGTFAAAPQVTQNVTINPANQAITFGANPGPVVFSTGGTFMVSATGGASGNAVTFTVPVTTTICSVAGNTVTILAAGTCTVAANQAGNASYNAAPQVTQSIVINPASQTITFGAQAGQTFVAAGTFAVSPLATASSLLAVTYSSLTAGVCTVAGSTVTMVSAGTCTLAANQAGNANFNAAPQVTQNVNIAAAAQTITFGAQAAQTFAPAGTFALSPLATASSMLAVTYSSLTAAVCTISGSTVTMVTAGTCTIAANQAGNGSFGAAPQVTQSITINPANQTITFGANPGPVPFSIGGSVMVSATGGASGLPVVFTTSTPMVCSVAGSTLSLLTLGTCTVLANQAGNASFNAAPQVSQNISITIGSQTITFAALPDRPLGPTPFNVTATASSALAVSFVSLTPAVCSSTGVNGATITTLALGFCNISASQAGNASFSAAPNVTRGFNVVVASGMTLTSSANLPAYGQPIILTATVNGTNPTGTVSFTVQAVSGTVVLCNAVPLVNRSAICPVPGRYNNAAIVLYTANYSGDTNNPPAAAQLQQAVNLGGTVLTAFATPLHIVAGRQVVLKALVISRTPTGAVTFNENGVPLPGCAAVPVQTLPGGSDSGVATCTIPAITAGNHTYVITLPRAGGPGFEQVILNVTAAPAGPRDYTDMWWAGAGENGWGVSITQHGTMQFAVLYVYDTAGKPIFYAMPGGAFNAAGTAFTGALYQPTSAPFFAYSATSFNPVGTAGASVGSATITYLDANNATLTYTINGVSGSKSITRQPFSSDDGQPRLQVNDLWWGGDAENGWGLNIAQQGRQLFPVWYTYDAAGKATWYGVPGGIWSGNTFRGDMYTTTSSGWLGVPYVASQFGGNKVGTLELSFIDQGSAIMTYTVNNVTQSKVIVRQPY